MDLPEAEWEGAVMLRTFIHPPWHEGPVSGLIGHCQAVSTKDILGFTHNMRDSNWCVVVTGRFMQHVVPGCEVLHMVKVVRQIPMDLNPQIVEVP